MAGRRRAGEGGEKTTILSYKWLCEERSAGRFFYRQVAIEVEKVFKGRCGMWGGVSPLPYRASPGGGSLDSAVGDRWGTELSLGPNSHTFRRETDWTSANAPWAAQHFWGVTVCRISFYFIIISEKLYESKKCSGLLCIYCSNRGKLNNGLKKVCIGFTKKKKTSPLTY